MSGRTAELMTLGAGGWRIELVNARQVTAGLARILTGWDVLVESAASGTRPADVRIVRISAGFRWHSSGLAKPVQWRERAPRTSMEAICEIHDALFDWLLAANPGWLCLHAAAARIGDQLVCFPSVGKAGKSTLMIELALRGHQIYCDDVLPIEGRRNRALALGIAPRLRRPLPATASEPFHTFLDERWGPFNRRWVYACLGEGEIAPFGAEAEIGALVLLERDDGLDRPHLEPIGKAEVLRELILQDFADAVPATAKLDRLIGVVERAACYMLSYARGPDAVRLLERQLACKPVQGGRRARA